MQAFPLKEPIRKVKKTEDSKRSDTVFSFTGTEKFLHFRLSPKSLPFSLAVLRRWRRLVMMAIRSSSIGYLKNFSKTSNNFSAGTHIHNLTLVFQQLVILLDLIRTSILSIQINCQAQLAWIRVTCQLRNALLCVRWTGRGISKSNNPNQFCQFT